MNRALDVDPRGDLEVALYEKREKVYPREVHGLFATGRVLAVLVLLGLYYALPWVTWSGRPVMLFDLPARKFHVFGLTFWPQDFFFLTALLILAALSLFFFTALAGRLWCGYACPQTVWTEVFLWIERHIEGHRRQQMKRDQAPWGARKVAIKGAKHAAWGLFALWTGFTFVGYFTPIRDLGAAAIAFQAGPWETFWILFYGFATYGNAGWLREQVCIYMCPYARFQSAMLDRDTLIISYDPRRGEPRGARPRGVVPRARGLGDCIDCTICVQACPTGIDIRDGLQYQCIGCAACVDACDDVMQKMGYPTGLIRYTTQRAVGGGATRVLRPRIAVYGTVLVVLFAATAAGIAQRIPLGLDVIRDRNALFRETGGGAIVNVYTLKVLNKDDRPHRYRLTASGIDGLELEQGRAVIEAPAGRVIEVPVRLTVSAERLRQRSTEVEFTIQSLDDDAVVASEPARFLGPLPAARR